MSHLLPKSLFGQTLLVMLAGLIISHLVGSWVYTSDREQAVRAVGGLAVAQRITNLTRLVQEMPREWRERIVASVSDPTFRVSLSAQRPLISSVDDGTTAAQAIRDYLVDELALGPTRSPLVSASQPDGAMFGDWHPMKGHGPMMHGFGRFGSLGGFRDLRVAVPLPDGQWLSFTTAVPESGPAYSQPFMVSMGLAILIILAVSVWAVRRVTSPLASLSAAAERLGSDLMAPPLPETGTTEIQQASRAFNAMQLRIRGLVENRTRMLAAISHDLRTPLTLLRLRAENVSDAAERERMLATIAEMDGMIAATLRFARDDAVAEPRRRTDLTALLASAVDDLADSGLPVSMEPAPAIVGACQPTALKRALTNLLDNAVKYGKRARTAIRSTPQAIEITIDDEGPGLTEDELTRVFQPFYRVENSRNRDTGGIGLGLAIALSVVEAHGGQLRLSNRQEGGLRASILLPITLS